MLPNKNNIETEIDITPKIEKEYDQYLGFVFEDLVRDLIRRRRLDIGVLPDDCGAWWHRGDEIDIVATGADTDGARQLFAGVVKWSNLSRHDVTRILDGLHRKSDLIRWHNDARREYYGIIAKRIEDKETLRSGGVYAFDLGDILRPK